MVALEVMWEVNRFWIYFELTAIRDADRVKVSYERKRS